MKAYACNGLQSGCFREGRSGHSKNGFVSPIRFKTGFELISYSTQTLGEHTHIYPSVFLFSRQMASKAKRGSDKPSMDYSTKPTDDFSDSSKPVDDSSFSESSKSSDDSGTSKPSKDSNSRPDDASKASQDHFTNDASKASQNQDSRPLNSLLDATVKSSRQVPVKVRGDYAASWVTGCAFLPNGYAVICDHSNNGVKLLDRDFSLQGSLNIGYPGDVAVLDNRNVIVTVASEEKLQCITALPSLKLGGTFAVGKKCYGVDVANDLIFVACHSNFSEVPDGEVRVFDYAGILMKRIGVNKDGSCMFLSSHNLAVSSCGTKICVSDLATRTVSCVRMDSKVIYQYKDASLKGPRNVYLDADNNALVCDFDNNTVQVITANGRKHRNILTSKHGIEHPNSIAFRPSDGTLMIGCAGKDDLFVFTLG